MRKSKKYQRPVRPLNVSSLMGGVTREYGKDGNEYKVHHITHAAKEYICPSCQGVIFVGESHEVVWNEGHFMGVTEGQNRRRHWHTHCWVHRGRAL
ncbi:MAG: ATP/GTP-binding protein [Actinomycetaceae bacterium]|nr:ATP/GTP-binding protein [Actinomycetaceae bacterium]